MPEETNQSEMGDEQLDALLVEARWPEFPADGLERVLPGIPAPATAARRVRTYQGAWWIGAGAAAAAGVALAATIWALWPDQRPPVAGDNASEPTRAHEPQFPQPRLTHAVLPGREATAAELAWVAIIVRERKTAANGEPAPAISQRPRNPSEKARPPGTGVVARPVLTATQRHEQLMRRLLDPTSEIAQRQDAARMLPASVIERALAQPELAERLPDLLAGLAVCEDPSAPAALLNAAGKYPQMVHQAVSQAPVGAAGVRGLIDLLDDPLVERRERAAALLAVSADDGVYSALARRLEAPAARREVLIALLTSDSPTAQLHVVHARAHPQLRAIIESLRLQGFGARRPEAHPQIIL